MQAPESFDVDWLAISIVNLYFAKSSTWGSVGGAEVDT